MNVAQQFVPLETTLRRAPLGLRFVDLARSVDVTDGLAVRAWRLGTDWPVFEALRSPLSGVYGFRSLPGLRAFEVGEAEADAWCPPGSSPPSSPPGGEFGELADTLDGGRPPNFVVTVEDALGRFLPQVLLMCLPKERLVEAPLFSAPARPAPSGMAVIRGQAWDRAADLPAQWALITAQAGDLGPYAGLADERGVFTLFMPYASPLPPLIGSPPYGSVAIDEMSWPVTIEVLYEPGLQRFAGRLTIPDMKSIIYQRPAQVYARPGQHDGSLVRSLRFNQELLVATDDLLPPNQSRLLVDPA